MALNANDNLEKPLGTLSSSSIVMEIYQTMTFMNIVLCEDTPSFYLNLNCILKCNEVWLCCCLPQDDLPVMKAIALQSDLIFSHHCLMCPVKLRIASKKKKKKKDHNINIYPYRLCQSYNAWHCLWVCKTSLIFWSYWFDHLILLIQKSKSVFRVAWLKLVKVFSSCMQLLVGLGGQDWRLTLWTAAAVSSLFLCFLWIVCYFWMFYRIKLDKFTFNKDKTGSSSSPYFYFLFFKCCLPFSFLS